MTISDFLGPAGLALPNTGMVTVYTVPKTMSSRSEFSQ